MYKYKYFSQCKTCKFFRYHPNVKKAMLSEIKYFNPQSLITDADFMRKYGLEGYVPRLSFQRHYKNHVKKIEQVQEVTIVNEKQPISKVMGELVIGGPGEHEKPLDAYIAQFHEKVKARELPITVKDGLQAIKIKADIENKNKNIKKDIIGIMAGTYDRAGNNTPQPAGQN